MPIDINNFWGSNYYNHPPLTDEMLLEAERVLGVKLPIELVQLLRIQNGGYTKKFAHPMTEETTWASDHVPLRDLAGVVTDMNIETAQNLLESEYLSGEWGLPPHQVLLSGGGHYWITLDYRNSTTPSVAWIDVESDEDIQIASSFGEFLLGLVPASTYEEA